MRVAGLIFHISSLPSPYATGDFGDDAYEFVDFLSAAGQSIWQILPLNPVDEVGSPYNSSSAFAIEPNFISPKRLIRDPSVKAYRNKADVIRTAFLERTHVQETQMRQFAEKNSYWIEDYCRYGALKAYFSGAAWNTWGEGAARKDCSRLLRGLERELRELADYNLFLQWVANEQWQELKAYANSKGVFILGDMPFYVAHDSADVWAHSDCFSLDKNTLKPNLVAGVPPDYFSENGQKWNMPVYDWDAIKKDGYTWWTQRASRLFELYDSVRIDHFRAIESFYAINAEAKDAKNGEWLNGPNMELIDAITPNEAGAAVLPRFIAEDLGVITPQVRALLERTGFPGMKVLQFALDGDEPFSCSRNCVYYTGTHDNLPLRAYINSKSLEERRRLAERLGLTRVKKNGIFQTLIGSCMASPAQIFMAQMQDYLNLGEDSRMNTPGTASGNWRFRLNTLPHLRVARDIKRLALEYDRLTVI